MHSQAVLLRMACVREPQPVAETILLQRDGAADKPQDGGEVPTDPQGTKKTAEPLECPLCTQPFLEDESGTRVPRILSCGHTACQGCFTLMLRPIAADGGFKKLACPECRKTTEVPRGKASNLLKNFALLR